MSTDSLKGRKERLRTARSLLGNEALNLIASVSPDARLLYVYGLMICDDKGRIAQEDLYSPWDPVKKSDALMLCAEFNLLGSDN